MTSLFRRRFERGEGEDVVTDYRPVGHFVGEDSHLGPFGRKVFEFRTDRGDCLQLEARGGAGEDGLPERIPGPER